MKGVWIVEDPNYNKGCLLHRSPYQLISTWNTVDTFYLLWNVFLLHYA